MVLATITQRLVGTPPDPDKLNDLRAARVDGFILAFAGTDDEATVVSDLIANIGHWCDRNGRDFALELEAARQTYVGDTTREEHHHSGLPHHQASWRRPAECDAEQTRRLSDPHARRL